MSAIPLGGHIRKSDTPGVGEYDPSDKERFSKKSFTKEGSYMFASSAKSRGSAGYTDNGGDSHAPPGGRGAAAAAAAEAAGGAGLAPCRRELPLPEYGRP